jgi:hypothetical protein
MMFTTAFIKCALVPGYQNWSDKEQEGKELKSYKAKSHTNENDINSQYSMKDA